MFSKKANYDNNSNFQFLFLRKRLLPCSFSVIRSDETALRFLFLVVFDITVGCKSFLINMVLGEEGENGLGDDVLLLIFSSLAANFFNSPTDKLSLGFYRGSGLIELTRYFWAVTLMIESGGKGLVANILKLLDESSSFEVFATCGLIVGLSDDLFSFVKSNFSGDYCAFVYFTSSTFSLWLSSGLLPDEDDESDSDSPRASSF